MNITYYGHSCFLIELSGHKILFDPFISPNELAKDIELSTIKCDYILITHAHEDHIADVETLVRQCGATLISNWEICTYYNNKGIEQTHPMNVGGKWDFEFGTVKMVYAQHSSSFPDGTYGGSASGFIIQSANNCFYYAGDTGLFTDMRMYGDMHQLDFAFLPIGDNFTMDIESALIASSFLNVKKVIGMHYQTFGYIEIDPVESVHKATKQGTELILLEIGSSIEL